MSRLRLGINIDHVATLRNARGEGHPDVVRAACMAKEAGADSITAHLREDRRHIKDEDMYQLKQQVGLPLNMEMAATKEMQAIALDVKPEAVCLVPEKREELTTEGGLDVHKQQEMLKAYIVPLQEQGIRVSMFIDPDKAQVEASKAIGADAVELHTGTYAHAWPNVESELQRIEEAARHVVNLEMQTHAGHGLNFDNTARIAAIKGIEELNIGQFLVGEAIFIGFDEAIFRMRQIMDQAR